MLQTLEPTWTLQGAPVGRLFVSSKGDLARIVGLVSQSMQQMPNTRGRWAADVLLFHRAHRRVNHGLLPHWPAPSHSRRGSCRFVTLECFGLAFCLLPLHKLWHISHPQESGGGNGPATTPSLHAAPASTVSSSCSSVTRHASGSSAASRDDHNNAGTWLAVSQHDD